MSQTNYTMLDDDLADDAAESSGGTRSLLDIVATRDRNPTLLSGSRALFIDLNNSARFPTLTIGYLVAALRGAGAHVDVLTPLAAGVPGYLRDLQDTWQTHAKRRIFFSTHPVMQPVHNEMHRAWRRYQSRPIPTVLAEVERSLASGNYDVILVSAYLDHYHSVREIGKRAKGLNVPLVVGGPAFNLPGVAEAWMDIPSLAALIAAESDHSLPSMIHDLLHGGDVAKWPGMFLPDGRTGPPAAPLADLSNLPVPDFTDFPWSLYPHPIVPVMTGRGCGWGKCAFCSDVATVNGRGFRSRPVDAVLDEISEQNRRHATKDAFFVDIKLNSDLVMWHGLIERYQDRVPGGRWVGLVHVDRRKSNGLSKEELQAARAAGMVRASFGLESGSQRLNDSMGKGTNVDDMSRVLRDSDEVGISIRTTMMIGHPGETEVDLRETAKFLREHQKMLHRIRISRFNAIPGTRFARQYEKSPQRFPGITGVKWEPRFARGHYTYKPAEQKDYRRAKAEVLNLVYEINKRPLPDDANVFNGLL
jgi:anaerobic magnesium-protoporphyrin IX monomethyl ester cyclase